MTDLRSTADLITVVAKHAHEAYETGCRGFRPRSSVLRQQRDQAMVRAVEQCRAMAEAWRTSGLEAKELPKWLRAALEDGV